MVAVEASVDVLTLAAGTLTSENGIILLPGLLSIVSTRYTLIGMLSSFSLKNKSTLVKKTPPTSLIVNVCASGSPVGWSFVLSLSWSCCCCCTEIPTVILSTVLLSSVSETVFERMIGTLVDSIVSCFVVCNPLAVNVESAKVSTSSSIFLFVDELVNLNTLSPVLNLTASVFGNAKVPDTEPVESVTKLPPITPDVGVT